MGRALCIENEGCYIGGGVYAGELAANMAKVEPANCVVVGTMNFGTHCSEAGQEK